MTRSDKGKRRGPYGVNPPQVADKHSDTKTGHRGDQKPIAPKNLTMSPERLQRIRDASFAEGRKAGFGEGVQHIVAQVEEIIYKELNFNSREELVKSGKMPAVWIAALIKAYGEDYEERTKKKAEEASERPRISSGIRGR